MKEKCSAILLVGNGINRAFEKSDVGFVEKRENWDFEGMSWKSIIRQLLFNYGNNDIKYEDISNLPMPLQIITATKDNVDTAMKALSKSMCSEIISDEKMMFCKKLLSLSVDDIITTNYTYELEQASGISPNKNAYYRAREYTKKVTKTEDNFRLYTYSDLKSVSKRLWHIHGDAASPKSIVMGHYWYGKLLREIEERVSRFLKIYRSSKGQNEKQLNLSWVDSFLKNDVYMLGFGFDTSELDLWWLACCKKRHFPETRIHFYTDKQEIDKGFKAMLDSYNIEIHNEIAVKGSNYVKFYENVIEDIENNLKEGQVK